jgi:hypothetical protein
MLVRLRRHPWLGALLRATRMMSTAVDGRTGLYRKAAALAVEGVIAEVVDMLDGMFSRPDLTVFHEDLVPPEILFGMGLRPWMPELLGIVLPMIEPGMVERYIDCAENDGAPPDACSLPKSTMGLFLQNQLPKPTAVVASNMPCDGGMKSYDVIERQTGAPVFRLDVPHNFYNERAVDYFVGELRRLIAWLEAHTPGRMDWDRLREICERRNRSIEYELELWDLLQEKPAPLAAEPLWIFNMIHVVARPGQPRAVETSRRLLELAKLTRARSGGAVNPERYRVALWNPPTLIFPGLFPWAEREFGAAMIMDMLSYHKHPYVDTSTPETMLRGLAQILMQGPMARHTRGPAENFFGDLFAIVERFRIDMVWMAAHIGCKNTQALLGLLREKCRARGLPLLIIDYDLSDSRITPPAGIKRQVAQFMETVMRA